MLNKICGRIIRSLLFSVTLFAGITAASDITNIGSGDHRLADGGYFELGASIYSVNKVDIRQSDDEPVQLSALVSGMYRYQWLFVEMLHQSQDGINLGFSVWNTDNWSLDVLMANLQSSWTRPGKIDPSILDEAKPNAYLMSELSIYVGAGFRATGYWDDNYVFQYTIVGDYYDNQGIKSTARLGKSWLLSNWNFHVLGSIEYSSATFNRYLFGISDVEATELFPEYRPDSSLSYGMTLGVAYPLSENFVFRAMYRLNILPKEVTDSPFNQAGYVSFFNASISYVF